MLWSDAAAAVEREPVQAMLERTAVELADALGATRTLVVGLEDDVVAVWMAGVQRAAAEQIGGVALGRRAGRSPAGRAGLPGAGIGGFRKSHEQAMHARRVARLADTPRGAIVAYDDVALAAIATADLEQARDFARRELGAPRRRHRRGTPARRDPLVYLEEGSSARRAAPVSTSTRTRSRTGSATAEDLIGHPITTRVAEMLLALRIGALADSPTRSSAETHQPLSWRESGWMSRGEIRCSRYGTTRGSSGR